MGLGSKMIFLSELTFKHIEQEFKRLPICLQGDYVHSRGRAP